MKASELREEYRQAIASPLIISEIDLENGLPFILYSNDWVRILFVRRADYSSNTIEVELSLSVKTESTQLSHKKAISTLIAYLNYILRLHEHGFRLEAMEDDILWTAVLELSFEPDIDLFEILIPPR
ncbi:MAG: hypothetical protein ACFFAX_03270 [Promethearchaeota archaeon]